MKESQLNIKVSNYTTNEGNDVAEIDIYGTIGRNFFSEKEDDITKKNIKNQLDEIRGLDVDQIIVNVSSMGGAVDDALVIFDLLREQKATVKTRISGYTASAGTIIAMAGDEISMSENALFLIHRARTVAIGSVNDMESVINDLKKTDERISNIYSNRGGESTEFYMDWMKKENGNGVWLDANEVKDVLGLIDSIDKQEYKQAAQVTADQIKNLGLPVPENLKNNNTKTVSGLTIDARLSDETKDALSRIENASKKFEKMQGFKKETKEVANESSDSSSKHITNKRKKELELYKLKQF